MKFVRMLLILGLLLPLSSLMAQQIQEFTGRVTDPTGAVVPKATVTALNLDTGVRSSTTTTPTGDYTIPYVIPGHYSVTVLATGFQTAVRTGIVLQVDQFATVNFALKVGAANETVTVNANPILNASNADNGEVIENTRVTELPLNGGDPGMLSILAPGTVWTGSPQWQRPFDDTQQNLSINGGGTGNIALMINGVENAASPINNTGSVQISYVPPVASVQEFKIVTNPYDAQYGLFAGGVEDVTLKTGTNTLHGSVYEFARRTWLDANTWQNDYYIKNAIASGTPANSPSLAQFETPPMKWDQYGAELDGPVDIPKVYHGQNKSFFALGYQNWHEIEPNTIVESVPGAGWVNGDFSNLTYWNGSGYSPIVLYDPETATCSTGAGPNNSCSGTWVRQLFGPNDPISPSAGQNIIPASRINPVAQAILKLYPAPNTTPPNGTNPFANNYTVTGPDVDRYRNVLGKWDQNWSSRDRFSLSYGYWERVEVRTYDGFTGPEEEGQLPHGERSHTFTMDETHTFTPNLLFDFRANAGVRADYSYNGPPFDPTTLLGWSSAQALAMGPAAAGEFPYLDISEFASMGTNSNGQTVRNSLALLPTVTWIKGKHSIHAGLDLRFWQTGYDVVGGGNNFWIDRTWTQKNCGSCGSWEQQDGNSIASLLLGNPTTGSDAIDVKTFWTSHYYAPFVQDDWKLTRKLTLNLGVRWDFLPGEEERHNQGDYAFSTTAVNPVSSQVSVPGFSQLLGGPTFLGVNGDPRSVYPAKKLDLQPRIGFAYALDNRTVLRGGFGESYRNPQNAPNSAGYSQTTNYQANDPTFPGSVRPNLANPVSNPYSSVLQPTGNSLGMETQLGQGPWFLNPHYVNPSFWNYSMGVERQFRSHDMVTLSYVGSRMYNNDSSDNINHESASAIEALSCNPDSGGVWENCNNDNVANPFKGISAFSGSSDYTSSTISGLALTQPFPEFGNITEYQENDGRSWYNSLQVDATHYLSHGLVLHGNYTYSKMMDAGGWKDETFRVKSRGIDGNDHTHTITVSGVYRLPVGRGRLLLANSNRLVDDAIGGWELGSLWKMQTGAPIDIGMYYLNSAHINRHIQKDNGYIREIAACVEQWEESTNAQGQTVYTMTPLKYDTDTSCANGANFENPEQWMPATNGVYSGRTLPWEQFDANLSKNFTLYERLQLQVRMEAFNALNHPVWNQAPDTNIQDSTFGTVERGAWGQNNLPRQMQLSAKIVW